MVDRVAKQLLIRGIDLTVTKGGKPIIDRVNLVVNAGEIVTLVGPNGAGKSTLIRVLLRLTECDTGRIERKPGLTVGYVPQFLEIDQTFPLNVRRFLLLGAPESKNKIKAALEEVGVATVLNTPMQGLSGGEMRRVLLARALLRDPDLFQWSGRTLRDCPHNSRPSPLRYFTCFSQPTPRDGSNRSRTLPKSTRLLRRKT